MSSENADKPAGALPGILFTAFEPSGDEHASSVIRELKRLRPDLPIFAWGGAEMQAAGAEIIERTGDDAVMGMPGLAKIREHQRINKRVAAWLKAHPEVKLHVPVDSPAANFPICKIAKKRGIGVLHLVAPQIWAWGGWRIHKLRKLTDGLLCLLPFEESWFGERGIKARFIGHPLFDHEIDTAALDEQASGYPVGQPRLALLPGSRPAEITRNLPLLLDSFREIRRRQPEAAGVVAATTDAVAERIRAIATESGGWPAGLEMEVDATDAIVRWSELALVVSGTVTLQVARQAPAADGGGLQVQPASCTMLLARWVLVERPPLTACPTLIAARARSCPSSCHTSRGPEAIVERGRSPCSNAPGARRHVNAAGIGADRRRPVRRAQRRPGRGRRHRARRRACPAVEEQHGAPEGDPIAARMPGIVKRETSLKRKRRTLVKWCLALRRPWHPSTSPAFSPSLRAVRLVPRKNMVLALQCGLPSRSHAAAPPPPTRTRCPMRSTIGPARVIDGELRPAGPSPGSCAWSWSVRSWRCDLLGLREQHHHGETAVVRITPSSCRVS